MELVAEQLAMGVEPMGRARQGVRTPIGQMPYMVVSQPGQRAQVESETPFPRHVGKISEPRLDMLPDNDLVHAGTGIAPQRCGKGPHPTCHLPVTERVTDLQ